MKTTLFAFLLSLSLPVWGVLAGLPAGGAKCPVCRMKIGPESKTVFSALRVEAGKETLVHVCSYSCAHALHKKRPESPITAYDFESGEAVSASDAWYVVKSQKVADQVEFGMPPVVAAFKDEVKAKALQQKVNEGAVSMVCPQSTRPTRSKPSHSSNLT